MVSRRPLVIQNGLVSELLQGDTVQTGGSSTEVIAGSGLVGGGAIGPNTRLDFAVAPNPSGLIYAGDSLGNDGVSFVNATTALSSGNAALADSVDALASGNAALSIGAEALASGNAALDLVPELGGGGNTAVLEAASAIASGYSVGVDDTGRVLSVATSIEDNSNPMTFSGSSTAFVSNAEIAEVNATYDSANNRVVVCYRAPTTQYGTAVVGTVSGSSISWGTPVVWYSAYAYSQAVTYDSSNEKVVIAYSNNFSYGASVVGTVSGSTISFGSEVVWRYAATYYISICYSSAAQKVVVAYRDSGGGLNWGDAKVGTVSGTSISFGSGTTFRTAEVQLCNCVYDSTNDKVVINYMDYDSLRIGRSVVGTISGTSISFGSSVTFNNGETSYIKSTFDSSNNRVVIVFRDQSNNNYGTAIVGTVSGTSISFGTEVVYESNNGFDRAIAFDSTANKVVINYENTGNLNRGTSIVGTVSGTSISFGASAVYDSGGSNGYAASAYDSTANRMVFMWRYYGGAASKGDSIVADPLEETSIVPTLNSKTNFLGISQSTVASGTPCVVNLPGGVYNEPAANLTPGAFYYANPTTSGITTTSTAPSPWDGQVSWNYIGKAITTSGLLLINSL